MKAQNSIVITAVLDGITINGYLYVQQAPLVQFFTKGTERYLPDFSVSGNQPIVSLVLRDSSTGMIFQSSGSALQEIKWKYNGLEMGFDSEGNCISPSGLAGKIKKTDQYQVTVDGQQVLVPTIRIVDNLVPISDFDDDRLSVSGKVVVNNQPIPFAEVSQTVQIKQSGGSALALTIMGDNMISGTETSETLKAVLMKDGATITDAATLANYTVKWSMVPPQFGGGFVNPDNDWELIVTKEDINGSLNIRCDVFEVDSPNTPAVTEFFKIEDRTDTWYLEWLVTPVSGNPVGYKLRRGESLRIKPRARRRSSQPITKDLGTCSWYTYNNAGAAYTIEGQTTNPFDATDIVLAYHDVIAAGGGVVAICHAQFEE